MAGRLAGKTVMVTAAAQGMGRAAALSMIPTAFAAPVDVGIIESAAARAR